ncbi:PD-(D/E)XK motif protein [Roseivirga sp. BDSF3-8]|uniref:PD-(D/E)XK motif protein n=1 Tax=Roseivirga sp. BDSF3-8 TaxID=3241598 RepID=UPI003531EC03
MNWSTRIKSIWKDLEIESSSSIVYKRLSPEIKPDIYVAINAREKKKCLVAHAIFSDYYSNIIMVHHKSFKVDFIEGNFDTLKKYLIIQLEDEEHADVFSVLCADLFQEVRDINTNEKLVQVLIHRISKWSILFQKINAGGLSAEKQRGLYGELYFLNKFLSYNSDSNQVLSSWKGMEGAVQDFDNSGWAVEVKTTITKKHQKINISNERQLDTSIVSEIYLYHLSLEARDNFGESLNDMVDRTFAILDDGIFNENLLRMKLYQAGYFEKDKFLYDVKGYTVREQNIFSVKDEFPRIEEKDLPNGVGDVKYSIMLPINDNWRITEEELLRKIS